MKEVNVKGGGEAVTSARERGEVMLWVGAVPVCDRYVGGRWEVRVALKLT